MIGTIGQFYPSKFRCCSRSAACSTSGTLDLSCITSIAHQAKARIEQSSKASLLQACRLSAGYFRITLLDAHRHTEGRQRKTARLQGWLLPLQEPAEGPAVWQWCVCTACIGPRGGTWLHKHVVLACLLVHSAAHLHHILVSASIVNCSTAVCFHWGI